MSSPSITREPHVFARQWYMPEEIRIALKWKSPALGKRMGNTIPEDVRSREFAEWLAEQMSLAMAKGGHPLAPHKTAFAWLWNEINGRDSWQANPWVWVVEFRRVKGHGS